MEYERVTEDDKCTNVNITNETPKKEKVNKIDLVRADRHLVETHLHEDCLSMNLVFWEHDSQEHVRPVNMWIWNFLCSSLYQLCTYA